MVLFQLHTIFSLASQCPEQSLFAMQSWIGSILNYERPTKTQTQWCKFGATKETLVHIMKDESEQTHLSVAHRERGVQLREMPPEQDPPSV